MTSGAEIGPRRRPVRSVPTLLIGIGLVAAIAGLGLGFALHAVRSPGAAAPAPARPSARLDGEATWAAGARAAPAIANLHDQSGHLFSLAALRGRSVAIAFLDSHCNQACPLEGRALAAAERGLPAARRPVLVAVSVNPADTPASARAAVRKWDLAGSAPWHWLMGSHAQLAAVWHAYRIYVGPRVHGDIAHTEALYLVDRRGGERSAYLYPFMPRFVAHDLTVLSGTRRG